MVKRGQENRKQPVIISERQEAVSGDMQSEYRGVHEAQILAACQTILKRAGKVVSIGSPKGSPERCCAA